MISTESLTLLVSAVGILVSAAMDSPPRLNACREIFKAKLPIGATEDWHITYNFSVGEACVEEVLLKNLATWRVNATDPRNCENFYQCEGLSCDQCPCPSGQTFNPSTMQCDNAAVNCRCPTPFSTAVVTKPVSVTDATSESVSVTETDKFIPRAAEIIPAEGTTPPTRDSTSGIAIIVVIVVLTVIVLIALILGFCMWQRGIFPLRKKPGMNSSNNDGYLHTLPPQERHVYAEIDERTVNNQSQRSHLSEQASMQLQHIYTPPLPSTYSPSQPLPCGIHHPHQTFTLPSDHPQRLYPQFTGYPVLYPQSNTSRDLIRFSIDRDSKTNFSQNNNQLEVESLHECSCGECNTTDTSSSVITCPGCPNCPSTPNDTYAVGNFRLLRANNNSKFVTKHATYI